MALGLSPLSFGLVPLRSSQEQRRGRGIEEEDGGGVRRRGIVDSDGKRSRLELEMTEDEPVDGGELTLPGFGDWGGVERSWW